MNAWMNSVIPSNFNRSGLLGYTELSLSRIAPESVFVYGGVGGGGGGVINCRAVIAT